MLGWRGVMDVIGEISLTAGDMKKSAGMIGQVLEALRRDRTVREPAVEMIRMARQTDEQAIAELRDVGTLGSGRWQ
jgi:hypothetical protein